MPDPYTRRKFLWQTSVAATAILCVPAAAQKETEKQEEEPEVTPNEDLMREHGLLRRVLLIYDASVLQLTQTKTKPDFDAAIITQSADIVRKFVEDYHEKLEQEQVFPRLVKAGKLKPLVETLLEQHQAGRVLTDKIKQSASGGFKNKEDVHMAVASIHIFQHMYRAHAAFEDTVLFPEFKAIVSPHEYDSLGEDFEKIETQQFGEEGFEHVLAQVAQLEKKLGIHDLATYTPRV
jgi:hemerythrin-like domain-containing protein